MWGVLNHAIDKLLVVIPSHLLEWMDHCSCDYELCGRAFGGIDNELRGKTYGLYLFGCVRESQDIM